MSKLTPSLVSVTTIREDGSRRFIHPATARGRFTTSRYLLFVVLLVIYAGLPWLQINGNPAIQLDVTHRQFHLFGATFVAQDLWLAFFLITGLGFSLFYVTALLGRIWCGWVCPQTVFLEVARAIERLIEGDAVARENLDKSIWTFSKTVQRILKHGLFVLFAFALANLFLSYFISLPELYRWMHQSPLEHWSAFLLVAVITAAMWFNLAWFREQFCIVLCPYGRLQSALIDNDTVVIGYDSVRGEPRGKKGTPNAGDCVDCRKCVQVCPTGIDIRQGLQMECIACSACIDACDGVMDKLERKRGLIRYDSQNGFNGKPRKIIRPRIIVYTLMMLLGVCGGLLAVSTFRPVNVHITRVIGAPYFVDKGELRNQFFLRIFNKRTERQTFEVSLTKATDGLELRGELHSLDVPPLGEAMIPLVIVMPREKYHGEFPVVLRITNSSGDISIENSVPFLGPISR